MKALITKLTFKGEKAGKFGQEWNYEVEYDGKKAYFTSRSKDNIPFSEGVECAFTETQHTSKAGNDYYIIKPIKNGGKSGYNKALQKEQSRYSGFSTSYAKDLVVAGKIEIDKILEVSEKLFNHMVELDKRLQND